MGRPMILAIAAAALLMAAGCGRAPTAAQAPAPTADTGAAPAPTAPPAPTGAPPTAISLSPVPATKIPPVVAAPAPPSASPLPTVDPAVRQIAAVQSALADLAGRLQVDPQTIDVVRVEEVEWPDGSVGCPRDDMAYTQALVSGNFIQLRAAGQSYNYHSGGRIEPFLCTSKAEVLPDELPPELRGGGEGT